jgi:hypothetical protein
LQIADGLAVAPVFDQSIQDDQAARHADGSGIRKARRTLREGRRTNEKSEYQEAEANNAARLAKREAQFLQRVHEYPHR